MKRQHRSAAFCPSLSMYIVCTEEDGDLLTCTFSPTGDGAERKGAAAEVAGYVEGDVASLSGLRLRLRGTPFQLSVWREISKIPAGRVATYGEVAARLGKPGAARAVGGAVGRNPVAIVIPCHRVVASGGIGGYSAYGGADTKRKLLAIEMRRAGVQPGRA